MDLLNTLLGKLLQIVMRFNFSLGHLQVNDTSEHQPLLPTNQDPKWVLKERVEMFTTKGIKTVETYMRGRNKRIHIQYKNTKTFQKTHFWTCCNFGGSNENHECRFRSNIYTQ